MNIQKKAKAGLCLLYEKWFEAYCDHPRNIEKGTELRRHIEKDSETVRRELTPHFDLIDPGPISSLEDARHASDVFRQNAPDLLIIVSLFWSGDKPLLKILETCPHLPLLVWCYAPLTTLPDHMSMNDQFRTGGIVGALQTSAPLRKLNKRFSYVFGTPGAPDLAAGLKEYGLAFAAHKAMRGLRLGQFCSRYEEMTGTYADEFFLLGRFGVEIVPVSAARLADTAKEISAEEVRGYLHWLKGRTSSIAVSDHALELAARASLAVGRIARGENLGAVALQDFDSEMVTRIGTRPQLWIPEFDALRIVPSMEADVLASLALWISIQLGDSLPMYTEIFAFDQERNGLLMGHAAMNSLDLSSGDIHIIPDAETGALDESEGAWLHFKGRSGPVTAAGLFDTGGGHYRATVFTGQAEVTELLDSSPNVFVRVEKPLKSLFETMIRTGMTQHFALSYDASPSAWEKFCEITGIEFVRI